MANLVVYLVSEIWLSFYHLKIKDMDSPCLSPPPPHTLDLFDPQYYCLRLLTVELVFLT